MSKNFKPSFGRLEKHPKKFKPSFGRLGARSLRMQCILRFFANAAHPAHLAHPAHPRKPKKREKISKIFPLNFGNFRCVPWFLMLIWVLKCCCFFSCAQWSQDPALVARRASKARSCGGGHACTARTLRPHRGTERARARGDGVVR